MFTIISLFASAVYLFCTVNGIYFHLSDGRPLCFIQDVPDDTLVQGEYQLMIKRGDAFFMVPHLTMDAVLFDPDGKSFQSRAYTGKGQITFTSHKGGEYRICISSDPNRWDGQKQLRVHLDIWTGDHAINYGEVATNDRLNDLQLRVRQLLDQVQTIAKDQNYQRVREVHFRYLSESTSERVTYWSIAQLLLLGAIGFWQMRHLRAFFQAKKLV